MTDNDRTTEVPEVFNLGDLFHKGDQVYFVDAISHRTDHVRLSLRHAVGGDREATTTTTSYFIDGWERVPVPDKRVERALHHMTMRANAWQGANSRTEQQYRDVRNELENLKGKVGRLLMALGDDHDLVDEVSELLTDLDIEATRQVTIKGTFSVTMTAPYKWKDVGDVDDDEVFDEMTSGNITVLDIDVD